ncbi:MAG: hypothetical protein M5U12_25775 [Verrucomicrobia bacterium]|nr:hypothetical protein [Verrucomicrobiota bacterium]
MASLALGVGGAAGEAAPATAREFPLLLTQIPLATPHNAAPTRTPFRPDLFIGARVVVISSEGTVQVLSEGLYSACDPALSFDARKVLVAGQHQAGSSWRVYERELAGQGWRAISPEHLDARQPIYVSTLFTLDSPEPWITTVFTATPAALLHQQPPASPNLFNVKLDGTELRRLTWSPHSSQDPFQMWDGRVIYTAESQPLEPGGPPGRIGLHAIHIEGADMESYGGRQGRRVQRTPAQPRRAWWSSSRRTNRPPMAPDNWLASRNAGRMSPTGDSRTTLPASTPFRFPGGTRNWWYRVGALTAPVPGASISSTRLKAVPDCSTTIRGSTICRPDPSCPARARTVIPRSSR